MTNHQLLGDVVNAYRWMGRVAAHGEQRRMLLRRHSRGLRVLVRRVRGPPQLVAVARMRLVIEPR